MRASLLILAAVLVAACGSVSAQGDPPPAPAPERSTPAPQEPPPPASDATKAPAKIPTPAPASAAAVRPLDLFLQTQSIPAELNLVEHARKLGVHTPPAPPASGKTFTDVHQVARRLRFLFQQPEP